MKTTLKVRFLGRSAQYLLSNFVRTFEQDISLSPSSLIGDIDSSLERVFYFLNLSIWQSSGMAENMYSAIICVFVDETVVHHLFIDIPHKCVTTNDILEQDKRISRTLTDFKRASREKTVLHIIGSQKFRNQ